MPHYQSAEEPAIGGGSYVDRGEEPHESLNFLPIGDQYFGFVENRRQRLNIDNLGAEKNEPFVDNVTVVFCAEEPKTKKFLITGWYINATAYRDAIERPQDPVGRKAHFVSLEARLVKLSDRCFEIPRARSKTKGVYGGIGQRNIWYGLNSKGATVLRNSILSYLENNSKSPQDPDAGLVESKKRRLSERLERIGALRRFVEEKGFECEACGWYISENEREVWSSSFELHHLVPLSELKEGESRVVHIEDFSVLCASCHRAIHRTKLISNIAHFKELHISPKKKKGKA